MNLKRFFSAVTAFSLSIGLALAPSAGFAAPTPTNTPNLVVVPPLSDNGGNSWADAMQETDNPSVALYKGKLYFEIYNYTTSSREMGRIGTSGLVETMTDKGIPQQPFGPAITFGDYLYYSAVDGNNAHLFRFDGTTSSKVSDYRLVGNRMHMAVLRNQLYVVAFDGESLELGIYKLTGAGVLERAVDFDAVGITTFGHYLVPFNDYLYFLANDVDGDLKYWKFDGNVISQAFELNPGRLDVSQIGRIEPTVYKDQLFFSGVALTGASMEKNMLFSLDKYGNIRSYVNPDGTSGNFQTFKLKVMGKYLYGMYYSATTQAMALFRFDGTNFGRIEGVAPSMNFASPVMVNGSIYTLGSSETTTSQVMVIEGLKAKPVATSIPGIASVSPSSAFLGYSGSLIFAGQTADSTNVTVRYKLDPRLWLPLSNGKLSATQLKQARAFLKANKGFKKITCSAVGASGSAAVKSAKAICASVTTGTSLKKLTSGLAGTSDNRGVSIVLSK